MPRTASATKRARQGIARHERLKPYITHMKTMMRKMTDATNEGKKEEAAKLLPVVFKSIDTAAKKNLIHRKNADRKKARMSRLVAEKKA